MPPSPRPLASRLPTSNPSGANRVAAAANARTFDSTFSAMVIGADGDANPNRAQIAKTTNIAAKERGVLLGHAPLGRRENQPRGGNSRVNRGRKKSARYNAG